MKQTINQVIPNLFTTLHISASFMRCRIKTIKTIVLICEISKELMTATVTREYIFLKTLIHVNIQILEE